jgi:ankyrin repeat protein
MSKVLASQSKGVNEHNAQRHTVLHIACAQEKPKVVQLLLSMQASVNASSSDDIGTPLHKACDLGHLEIASLLLQAGASLSKSTKQSNAQPLHRACGSSVSNAELVQQLIAGAADVNATTTDLSTPLHLATNQGSAAIVRVLCQANGIKLDAKDKNGLTPLLSACTKKHEDVVAVLVNAGADVHVADVTTVQTPLHRACLAQNKVMAEMLLQHGAKWDCWDKYTGSPLQWACSKADFTLVSLLLDHGAPPNHTKYTKLGPPLVLACQRDRLDIAQLLLHRGAEVNGENQQGVTPLAMAISNSNIPLVKLLLEHSATLDSRGTVAQSIAKQSRKTICSLYELCCIHGRADIVPALLSHPEFQPNMQFRGYSPLVHALLHKQPAIARALIDSGAKPYGDPQAMQLLFALEDSALIDTCLRAATKKRDLILSNCNLNTLPVAVVAYLLDNPKIKSVDLSHNNLQTLPVEMADLPIDVITADNPLNFIPECHRSPWQKLRAYLPTIKERSLNWREYKLVLLGEGAAGKSTLAQCLMAKRSKTACSTNLATNGINILKGVSFEGKRAKAPINRGIDALGASMIMSAQQSTTILPSTTSLSSSQSLATSATAASASSLTLSSTTPAAPTSLSSSVQNIAPVFNIWDLGGQEGIVTVAVCAPATKWMFGEVEVEVEVD